MSTSTSTTQSVATLSEDDSPSVVDRDSTRIDKYPLRQVNHRFGSGREKVWANDKEKRSAKLTHASGIPPVQVRWENLTCKVPKPITQEQTQRARLLSTCSKNYPLGDEEAANMNDDKNTAKILNRVSGTVNPGEMLGILGPSGAGKSSLLNILSNRRAGADIQGKILLNGVPQADAIAVGAYQAYIMQDDVLMGSQTPREALRFSARVRLPRGTTKEQAEDRVTVVLKEMNLIDCADLPIGTVGEKRGISGGQRKRTAIGVELVTNPSLLFVDEPTSGLDAIMAERCVETLKRLAQAGRTVIITIHQPSSKIFERFDKVLLLAKGRTVFFGPREELYQYWSSINTPIPSNTNPAEFLVDACWVDETSPESKRGLKKLSRAFADSAFKKQFCNTETILQESTIGARVASIDYVPSNNSQAGFWKQLRELTVRHFRDVWRDPKKIYVPLCQSIFTAILLGSIFFRIGNGQTSAQDRIGVLFFVLFNQTLTGAYHTISTFILVKGLFLHEHSNKMYRATPFFFSRVLGDLPLQVVSSFLYATLTFWMIGFAQQKDSGGALTMYLMYLLQNLLVARIATGVGFCISIIAPTIEFANAILTLTLLPFFMFSGFYINIENIPVSFSWLEAISPLRYGFENLVVTVVNDVKFTCEPDQRVGFMCPADLSEDAPPDLQNCECRIQTGEQVVDNLNFSSDNLKWNIVVLVSMMMVYSILGHWALMWVAQKSSNA